VTTIQPGLRERKKEQTRRALVDAAISLFGTKGYEETTIAELAAAANVSPRTFFSYFESKEEILFAGTPLKLGISAAVLTDRRPDERPADLLLRALRAVISADTDMLGEPQRLRVAHVLKTPALQAYALRKVLQGQREFAKGLLAAYPDELDEVTAAALTGALVGALVSTIATLFADPDRAAELAAHPEFLRAELDRAIRAACQHLGAAS
jgi:AcrR family transcriptional regulator